MPMHDIGFIPSLGLASIQILISESQSARLPASRRSQVLWQRRHWSAEEAEVFWWTWAERRRTPASSWTVEL